MEGMIGIQWIIFIGIAVVSWLVQMNLQNKFKKYSVMLPFRCYMTMEFMMFR